jgi:cytochrome c553
MKRYSRSSLVGAVLVSLLGCGSDAGGDEAGGSSDALEVFPPKLYSGFDGTNAYKVPVIAHGATGKVTWKVSDESVASLTPSGTNSENVTLLTKKAGSIVLTATAGGKSSTATLTVVAYTAAQHEAGAKRYMTMPDEMNPPCVTCHGAERGSNRPNHTPTELDADTDAEIQKTFTSGVDPEGRRIVDMKEFSDLLTSKGYTHMWKVTDEEKIGLMAYLRSLEPIGFPEYDEPTTKK